MVQIRRMQTEDVEYVHSIMKEKIESVSDLEYCWNKQQIERWINTNDILLVAEDEGKVIGFIASQFHKPTEKATIEDIYVEERKKDIETDLIKECLNQLKEKGASYICYMVKTDDQETIKILESLGFNKGYDFTWVEYIL